MKSDIDSPHASYSFLELLTAKILRFDESNHFRSRWGADIDNDVVVIPVLGGGSAVRVRVRAALKILVCKLLINDDGDDDGDDDDGETLHEKQQQQVAGRISKNIVAAARRVMVMITNHNIDKGCVDYRGRSLTKY